MLYLGLLQDFIRQVCKPAYTNCFRDRDGMMGVVEFETADDMDRTIRWVVPGGWGGWLGKGLTDVWSTAEHCKAFGCGCWRKPPVFPTAACALHLCVCLHA